MTDLDDMRRAYDLAVKGRGRTAPNPMVGAVVVRAGKVVGEGWHQRCGGPHAEVFALREAGKQARGATLYVTLEPCGHEGRTPPCVDAVIAAGVRKVVVGMRDPNPQTNGKSLAKLRRAGIKVKVGFLQNELRQLNAAFFKYITTGIPLVVTKTAATLDGKIATSAGQSRWITSPAARAFAHHLRDDFDAILVGINTVIKDDPGLNADRPAKRLKKIILDSTLRMPRQARLLEGMKAQDCFLVTTDRASVAKVRFWQNKGLSVLVAPVEEYGISWPWLLRELGRREVTHLLVEGGARVVGSALRARVVDKILWFVAPKIFGGQEAFSAVQGLDVCPIDQALRLKNLTVRRVGEDFLIEGAPEYGKR